PGDSTDTSHWKPIGTAQVIPSILPTQPAILEWEWNTPTTTADQSCLLVVTDCTADPIQAANKVLNIADLVSNEKHVGLKNLHVVNVPPGTNYCTSFQFFVNLELRHTITIPQSSARGWGGGLHFEIG